MKRTNPALFIAAPLIIAFVSCKNETQRIITEKANSQLINESVIADNKLLKVFETGDVNMLDSIIASNFVNHSGGGDKIGLDSQKAMVKAFHASVNNVKMELKRQWSDSSYVVDWVRYTGTNPDVAIEGIEVTSYENGKAKEHWFFPSNRK